MDHPVAACISYKPSTFYFRLALRATDDPEALRAILRSLAAELELCFDFARSHGICDAYDGDGGLFDAAVGADELRTTGLVRCCRLEDVRQAIRAQGLIPPKKHIMTSEARDKGWPLGAA